MGQSASSERNLYADIFKYTLQRKGIKVSKQQPLGLLQSVQTVGSWLPENRTLDLPFDLIKELKHALSGYGANSLWPPAALKKRLLSAHLLSLFSALSLTCSSLSLSVSLFTTAFFSVS